MSVLDLINKTQNNLLHLYHQISKKYSNNITCHILYNGYIYVSLSKLPKDVYLTKNFVEHIPFPYPYEVMHYIKQIDEFTEDNHILNTLLIKAGNISPHIKSLISSNIEFCANMDDIQIFCSGTIKEQIYEILDDSPEAVEVIKKFNANNLLL